MKLDTFLLQFGNNTNLIIKALILILLEFINILVAGYTGIILGHKMNNHKTSFSVLFGFITYGITQISVLIVILAFAFVNQDYGVLFQQIALVDPSLYLIFTNIIWLGIFLYTLSIIIWTYMDIKWLNGGINVD